MDTSNTIRLSSTCIHLGRSTETAHTYPYQRLISPKSEWGLGLLDTPSHWKIPTEFIGRIRLINEHWMDMAISWSLPIKILMKELGELQPLNSNPTLTADNRFEFYYGHYYPSDLSNNFSTNNVLLNSLLTNLPKTKPNKPISPFYISMEGILDKRIKKEIVKLGGSPGKSLVNNRIIRYEGDHGNLSPGSDHSFKNHLLTPYEIWLRYKLATSSLKLNGQIGDNDGNCQLCNDAQETSQHLFLEYREVTQLIDYANLKIETLFHYTATLKDWICTTSENDRILEVEKIIAKTQATIFAYRNNKQESRLRLVRHRCRNPLYPFR